MTIEILFGLFHLSRLVSPYLKATCKDTSAMNFRAPLAVHYPTGKWAGRANAWPSIDAQPDREEASSQPLALKDIEPNQMRH
jgi:hypothetical protein